MARPATPAEKMRAHRQAFLLALELGCTPKEAEAQIARIAEREQLRALRDRRDRLNARMNGPLPRAICGAEPESRTEPWMMRD